MVSSSRDILKILIVTSQKHVGGVNTVIFETAEVLASLNHQVFIIQGRSEKNFPLIEKNRKVRIFNYAVEKKGQIGVYFSVLFGALRTFNKLLKTTSFDVIHFHLSHSAIGIMLSPGARKIPKIYHFHGAASLELKSRISKPRKHKILGRIKRFIFSFPFLFIEDVFLKICLRKVEVIISPSQWAKELLIKRFKVAPEKIEVIKNGVNPKRFHPLSKNQKKQTRKAMGFSENFPLLTIISRLEPRKGIDEAMKALPIILKKYPNSLLAIAFPLTKESKFYYQRFSTLGKKLKINKNIKFVKTPSGRELVNLYQISDCFLMSSKTLENFPLTILESLACGTPVLGTPIGGIPEGLGPFKKELLLKGTSVEEIAKGVINFFSKRKKEASRNKYVEYAQSLSWEKQTSQIISLYQRLLTRSW